MKGWLVSKDSLPHRKRWGRVLAPYFDDFQIVFDDEEADDWVPDSDSDLVFTTNILDTSLRFESRIRPDRHIAISNSLDLMVLGAELNGESLRNGLPLVREFWVDTNWAVRLLQNVVECDVYFIPWGLEKFEDFEKQPRESGAPIVLPRLSSPLYNPDLLLEVVEITGRLRPTAKFVLLGLPLRLHDRAKKIGRSLTHDLRLMPSQTEEQFLKLLDSASAVLMAPKTDGSSVTMLQAISGRVPVISTPTIGAQEWITGEHCDLVAKEFSAEALAFSLQFASTAAWHSAIEEARERVLNLADLRLNVKYLSSGFRRI